MWEKFEKEGLVFNKERVLSYSRLKCPLECRYCFSEELNPEQEKGVAYLSDKQIELLQKLPDEIKLIMLGCDTEFLQNPKNALEILRKLTNANKDISIITKLTLSENFIKKLSEVDKNLKEKGNLLVFSMSTPCLQSASFWEPKVSAPKKRIDTLKRVYETGIKTLVAIRPLLPSLSEEEMENIVELTHNNTDGFYSGPLYLKQLNSDLLSNMNMKELKIEKIQPVWLPKGNEFYKIEKDGQMENLKAMAERYNKYLFEGAAEAIKYLKTNEKH